TLANNSSIEGHPAYGIEQITAAAGPLFDNANKLINNLDGTVADLKGNLGDFMPKVSPLLDSLKIDVEELLKVAKGLQDVEGRADTVLGTANTFIANTDKQFQDQLRELHVTLL